VTAPLGRVTDLFVYPIKSLAGVRLERADVGDLGLTLDRRWMLVDADGVFRTQRELPHLALARATPDGDGIVVTAPGEDPLSIAPSARAAPRRRVRVWHDVVEAATYPAAIDAWFTRVVGAPTHLVHMPDDVRRPVDPTYASADDRAAFCDAFPLLLLSRESLGDLNARLEARGVAPAVVERFRPNVVVDGTAGPFAEDGWRDVRIGEVALAVAKPCARCVLPTVDPATGVKSPRGEPLRTLAEYRTRNGKVLFAQNVLVRGPGRIAVGDAVLAG
jgi:uncharacterized protein YcbX